MENNFLTGDITPADWRSAVTPVNFIKGHR